MNDTEEMKSRTQVGKFVLEIIHSRTYSAFTGCHDLRVICSGGSCEEVEDI
jgi:hypothetical protein